ncbi:nudix hydrolase 8 isoform X3 [Thrips palmi]|uniref:Nudix hydrolase 8 isoform X3 n=1 Tax=Thrips palmi TaxID=161013 RepID=A0A6P8YZJ9_THRPL|nr:nudix hydrolase 8 isoform X3 [Thrips palmi]
MIARGLLRPTLVCSKSIRWKVKDKLRFDFCDQLDSRPSGLCSRNRSFSFSTFRTMCSQTLFVGTKDRFQGITVDSTKEPCEILAFPDILKGSLNKWREDKVRGVWFKVALADSGWVPHLAQNGFRYHHAQASYVMMVAWLPENEVCNIPQYASTMVGVGAIVMNDKRQILVVSEKYRLFPHWKLPGGYVEPGEEIVNAAEREVLEETSVRAKFKQMICFRHVHNFTFGCSDMYFIVALTPEPGQEVLKKCDREIDAVEWMNVEEYLNHPNVHSTNRFFVSKFLEYEASGISLTYHEDTHQILKKSYLVYSLDLGQHKKMDSPNDTISQSNKQ